MLDFFKKIMPNFSNKKSNEIFNNDTIKLYLDRKKKTFIPIKIKPDSTCQEIHSAYHSEILNDISQLYLANNYNNGQYSKMFNSKDYNFIIIDDENKFIEIKMKEIDCPIKYFIKPTVNLYYLNIVKDYRRDSFDSELNSYSINNVSKIRKQTDSDSKLSNIIDLHNNSIIDNIEESIREGDLMKFSNKKKCFEKRKVIIDKKKLIIEKKNKNDAIILLLRDIKLITRDSNNLNIDAREKFIFEITTMEGEKLTFKSKNNADFVSWLETIEGLVNLIRDNELILYFEENIKKEIKDINDKGKQILIDCLSLRGILSIYETRQIFFKFFDNPLITSLIELIISYKINVKFYKYKDALLVFKNIVNYIDIDNLDVNLFHNQLHFDFNNFSYNDRKRFDLINKDKNNSMKKRYTINDIKSRNVIFDSKSNNYNTEGTSNLSINEAVNTRGDFLENNLNDELIHFKSNKNNLNINNDNNYLLNSSKRKNSNFTNFYASINNNTTNTDGMTSIGKESLNKINEKSNDIVLCRENPNGFSESVGFRNELMFKTEKDEGIKLNGNEYIVSDDRENQNKNCISIENKEINERRTNLITMLKNIITIDIIMSLKLLKNEIREYFDKYDICIFGPSNDFDFSQITVQEQNIKFSEFLKLGAFNDIYENTLSKYFNDFYKSVFNNKEFLGSLEKILVHYFKVNNQLVENPNKLIDFNDIIKSFAQKQ